jgi:endonuclease III
MLRWLTRPNDGVDLGLWSLSPSRLILPLDTHTARLARWLGLSDRRTADRKMAVEATARLLLCDPADPMKYDMPLCHLGISRECRHAFVAEICSRCPLEGICSWTLEGAGPATVLDPVSTA